jgi:flagellar motor switch protein FliM
VRSQVEKEEIEALLGTGAERPAPEVSQRDFTRPRRLSAEFRERYVRRLQVVLPELEAQFAQVLRHPVQLDIGAVGELAVEEIGGLVSDPLAVLCFRAGRHPAWAVWQIKSAVAAVEQVLGAPLGSASERALSSLERGVLERILKVPAESICRAFGLAADAFSVPAKREQLGSWSDAEGHADPHRMTLELHLRSETLASTVLFYLPVLELRHGREDASGDGHELSLPDHLGAVSIDLAVRLGSAEFALSELLALEVGDVVVLDSENQSPASLLCDGRQFALGRLGRRRGRLAVQVLELKSAPEND